MVWSPEYRELVSGHGYANNEVIIWKYPTMVKSAELLGHTDRVLNLALSTDNTTVVRGQAFSQIGVDNILNSTSSKRLQKCCSQNQVQD